MLKATRPTKAPTTKAREKPARGLRMTLNMILTGDVNMMKVADPDTDAYQANKDDFVKGCGDAFRDHPPSLPTATTGPQH